MAEFPVIPSGLTTLWPFLVLAVAGIYLVRNLRKKWKKKNI